MEKTMLDGLRRLNRLIAILVGILLLACTAFVLLDIVMRQMGSSLGGTDEISGYVMAIATAWGMGFTLIELGHVRIDLLRSRVASRGRALFDLVGSELGVSLTPGAVDHVISRHYRRENKQFRFCHPRDLLLQVLNESRFLGVPPVLNEATADRAVDSYFSVI